MVVRILHVVTDMRRGGLETMLMNYYRQIDRNKIQFDFLVHRNSKGDYDDEIEYLGGNIYRIPKLNPISMNYYKALNSFFSEHKYEIVHSHIDCMSAYPLKAAKKAGVSVRIAHAHSNGQDKNWKYPIKYLSAKRIHKYATDYFACSREAGEWMFSGRDFLVVKNAINIKEYAPNKNEQEKIKEEFDLENNRLIIGHVGRFSHAKNHSFLIDVFSCIKKYRPDACLILVGYGQGIMNIKSKVKQLNLENDVIFTGIRSDVSSLMQIMDAFVFPSYYEGLGIVVVEAQAAGLPCIISNTLPEECIVTKSLVSRKNLSETAEEWAKHILERICSSRSDHTQEIIENGYDIKNATKWLEEYYIEKNKR